MNISQEIMPMLKIIRLGSTFGNWNNREIKLNYYGYYLADVAFHNFELNHNGLHKLSETVQKLSLNTYFTNTISFKIN